MLGIAIARNGQLQDWQLKNFKQKWSRSKLKKILLTLDRIIDAHEIQAIAAKIPNRLPGSKAYAQLVGGLNVLCERKGISISYYALADIKERYCTEGINKKQLAELIAEEYPEIGPQLEKERRNGRAYYDKVFEAVAAMGMSLDGKL
jgi:hypothetical protein